MTSADPSDIPAPQPPPPEEGGPEARRYRMLIAYDGTLFHGWQRQQVKDGPALRTVGGVMESALAVTLQQPVRVVGASRTDSGVHARGQVAHFDADTRIPLERLVHAFNSRLPDDVEVLQVEPAANDFNAIAGARSKQYRYRIFNTHRRPLHERQYVWHCWCALDIAKMREAAARLVGTHDYAGFAAADHGRENTVRTIFRCEIDAQPPYVDIVVEGNGFLYNMVRILAGTLVEVGRGRFEPARVDEVLATRNRRLAGTTLPPTGLWLEWIRYDNSQ